jgi:hypothetical protein
LFRSCMRIHACARTKELRTRSASRARGCSHCEINEFFTMDTLTVAGPGQQKRPRCFMTTMRAILRKDERKRERERERERESSHQNFRTRGWRQQSCITVRFVSLSRSPIARNKDNPLSLYFYIATRRCLNQSYNLTIVSNVTPQFL